ncbi:MAG TPA: hypothetical protein VL991_06670 [Terracidiphilus sp.]|jgi:hypothetical protein|nr:hypothetical protein [Terracidiphilus sp.]
MASGRIGARTPGTGIGRWRVGLCVLGALALLGIAEIGVRRVHAQSGQSTPTADSANAQNGSAADAQTQNSAVPDAQKDSNTDAQSGGSADGQNGTAADAQNGAAADAQNAPSAEGQNGAAAATQTGAAGEAQNGAAPAESPEAGEKQVTAGENAAAATPTPAAKPATPSSPEQLRKQEVVTQCASLLKMATDLKTEVDKTTKDELSLAVVRKAGELEQFARKVRVDPRLTAGKVESAP